MIKDGRYDVFIVPSIEETGDHIGSLEVRPEMGTSEITEEIDRLIPSFAKEFEFSWQEGNKSSPEIWVTVHWDEPRTN